MACHPGMRWVQFEGPFGPDRKKQEFWAPAVAVQRATTGGVRRSKGSDAACA